jgi:large subunit ribosomal protein L22
MANYSYSTKIGEKDAAAVGKALPISTKQSIEICAFIRGKKLEKAKAMLDNVLNKKISVPFKRFTNGIGHRKGRIAAGSYPENACTAILSLLNSAQANAQFKGLSSSDLVVSHISAQKGTNTWKYGRRRRKAKNTTIEIVLSERAEEKKGAKKEEKKEEKPEAKEKAEEKKPKAEEKKEEKAPEPKKSESPKIEPKTEGKPEK